jgi:hypothetical protein
MADQWDEIEDAALTVHKDGGSRLASLVLAADDRIEELEAKLAKAVNTLEFYAEWENWIPHLPHEDGKIDNDEGDEARATLAELERKP